MRTRPKMGSWPKSISFVLALIPLGLFLFVIIATLIEGAPAFAEPGLGELFSTRFCSHFTDCTRTSGIYGLIPAMWGTFLAVAVAVIIVFPMSLAMAVVSTEFPLGFLGRGLRAILGAFSGIPPIVYALVGLWAFNAALLTPKLSVPAGGAGTSLTAGILLALLAIPFVAPLMDDAIKNVPSHFKEASLALGANRWHTLWRITLPLALPGIMAAASLGALKAMGDVMIVLLAVGPEKVGSDLPQPLWDVLERTPTLTSTGVGLAGMEAASTGGCRGEMCDVAFFSAIVLLVMAFLVLGLVSLLQRRFKRRFGQ